MGARHLSAGAVVVLVALLVAAGNPELGAVSRARPAYQEATTAIADDVIAADEAELRAAIEGVLDPDTRRGVSRLPSVRFDPTGELTVVVALRDFGTLEAIRDGAEEDALAILRAIYESPVAGRVRTTTLIGTFAVTGTRGTRELRVMRVVLSAERAAGIEWGAVGPADLAPVTDLWKLYPPFGTLDRLQPLTEPDPVFSSLVDIGDRRLFLRCIGTGGPTVILEGGYGDDGTIWGPVQLPVARFSRVCSYDRAGLMRSDPPDHYPRTAEEVVADLHALLTAAEVKPPYVLVGHSFGALYVRLFAATYPDEVAGLVLVDPWHEDYDARLRSLVSAEQWTEFERLLVADPDWEAIDRTASYDQVRAAAALPAVPTIVLSHGRPADPSCCPPGWPLEAQEQLWQELQNQTAVLVPGTLQVTVEGSGHGIHQAMPEAVIEAIAKVVAAVREPGTWQT